MAAGVAHEVKNPLSMLQMGVDFFFQRRDSTDVASELMLRRMGEAIDRADRIVRDLGEFSRTSDLVLRPEDVNLILNKAINLTHHELTRRKVVVKSDFAEALPKVNLDRMKIEQVLVNLITNGAQAMLGGGVLEVKTSCGKINDIDRDEGLRTQTHLRPGDPVVVVEIRDFGTGIPEDKLSRIFDPFFTTKEAGKGTGLGLLVAKTIVDLHHATIRVRNVEPCGVLVQLIFRALEAGADGASAILPRTDKAEASCPDN
jgi:signal transduction histidine kinase